ncbi:MAG: hypothetical protein NVS9B12_08610 [Vulcanimicrobiaceae bacterium]
MAELQAVHLQPLMAAAHDLDDARMAHIFASLDKRVRADLLAQGASAPSITFVREYDARYAGQSFELTIGAQGSVADARQRFHERHKATYGYAVPDEEIEIVNARVSAAAPVAQHATGQLVPTATSQPAAQRAVWFAQGVRAVQVFQRETLAEASSVKGPAIIEQYDACTYLAPAWNACIQDGDIVVERAA